MGTTAPATELADRLGGRYRYVRELGRGAIGRVVLVEDAHGGAARAAKIVGSAHGERLRWELSLLTSLSHPSLASVHELLRLDVPLAEPFAIEAGTWVLIEELAPGRSSDAIVRALPDLGARVDLALRAGAACARALAAMHAAGLVHGDVKPANVVVPDPPGDAGAAKLVDLGLAGPPGHGAVVGTPAFLAPEAWLGERSAASDLFALGMTLHRWLVPEPGDPSATASDALPRGTRVAPLPLDVPEALRALAVELVRDRVDERPGSAREVARRLDAIAGRASAVTVLDAEPPDERARRVAAIPVRGRAREIAAIRAALERPGVVVVHGPPGAGRTRAIREAVRALQSDRAASGLEVPTWIAGALPPRSPHAAIVHDDAGTTTLDHARAAVRAAELDGGALVVVLERDAIPARDGVPTRDGVATRAGVATRTGVATREGVPDPGRDVRAIALGPIDDDALRAIVEDALGLRSTTAALRDAARAASSGLPGRLCRLIAAALAEGRDPSRPDVLRAMGREEGAAIAVPDLARPLADALAVAGGTLRIDEAAPIEGAARRAALLAASGLASFEPSGLALRPDRARAVLTELSPARRRAIARTLDRTVTAGLARACVDAELGRTDAARAQLVALADRARSVGDPLAAAEILRVGAERTEDPDGVLAVARADALRAAGEDEAALTCLGDLASRDARLARCELLRLNGELDRADAIASELAPGDDEIARAARCARARIAWSRGDLDRADELARGALPGARGALAARAREIEALGAISRGDPERAAAAAAEAERAAATVPGAAGLAAQSRAASIAGSAALIGGAIARATSAYERAADLAERAGERHAAASATVNRGLASLDGGRLGPAIDALRAGARKLASLRRARELARALSNLANAAFLAGDDALATLAAERARDAAADVGDRDASAHAAIVLADLDVRAGRVRGALRALAALDASDTWRPTVLARRAIAHASLGEIEDARAAADEASRIAAPGSRDAVEASIASARASLAAGEAPLAETSAASAMSDARTFEARVRAALVGADAAEACGLRSEAALRLASARALLDAAAEDLDPSGRARLRAVGAYQRALATRPATDDDGARSAAGHGRVIAVARRIAAEHRPGRVIEAIALGALELTGAERAFVLARGRDGTIAPLCARGVTGKLGDEHRPSRSISARVIDGRRPMVSVDALADTRLDRVASVHALALRSVLAVPVPTHDGGALALYVDDRLRPAAFDDATVADLSALADLGAAALANAERWRDERRAAKVALRRARSLEQSLDARAEELRSLRAADVPGSPFAAVVATSEAMRSVLALASRVAASGVSVLIQGESGTGKELLARAIHAASPRAERAFVAESCAAVPEGLLESTLFGHVRGAFTGADRARRGLFEIADGGTLFLDEVAETSPSMQAKLLRALQEGEIRAVGSERVRRVDVRIVAATRADLRARIADELFREDLFYRLAVVTIEVPPLRDRLDDVAPLAERFVARHAGRAVRIDARALERLRAHPWPGNARQLENEIQRALLVCGDTLSEEHLSAELVGVPGAVVADLDLKAHTESLERRLISRALAVHAGNQTRAARALGLSRFGLQKMLKRLGLEGDQRAK